MLPLFRFLNAVYVYNACPEDQNHRDESPRQWCSPLIDLGEIKRLRVAL